MYVRKEHLQSWFELDILKVCGDVWVMQNTTWDLGCSRMCSSPRRRPRSTPSAQWPCTCRLNIHAGGLIWEGVRYREQELGPAHRLLRVHEPVTPTQVVGVWKNATPCTRGGARTCTCSRRMLAWWLVERPKLSSRPFKAKKTWRWSSSSCAASTSCAETPLAGDYECAKCGKRFANAQALQGHTWKWHGEFSEERKYVFDATCRACGKCWWCLVQARTLPSPYQPPLWTVNTSGWPGSTQALRSGWRLSSKNLSERYLLTFCIAVAERCPDFCPRSFKTEGLQDFNASNRSVSPPWLSDCCNIIVIFLVVAGILTWGFHIRRYK